MSQVSVVLPTLNENENLKPLVEAVFASLGQRVEIVVIDDESSDGTAELADRLAAENPRVRVIHRRGERGLTSAIQRGIRESRGDIICWMDVDFSHPPELLATMTALIERGEADVVVASRYLPESRDLTTEGQGWVTRAQKYLSRFLSWSCERILRNRDVSDWTSGFVAIRAEPLKRCHLVGDYGDYFIGLMLDLRALGCRCVPLPFVSPPRRHGYSKTAVTWFGLLARGYKYLWALLKAAGRRYP